MGANSSCCRDEQRLPGEMIWAESSKMGVPTQAALTGNPDHPPDNPESATEQLERNHQSDDCKDGPSGLQAVQTDSSEPVEDHVGWIKMTSWSQLEVDPDIFRSVSLRQTLRGGGRLWRKSPLDLPEESRKALWEQSHPAAVLDVFLSHTWRTSGRWKVFALLLQSGWMFLLLSWMGFLVVLVALYKAERGLAMPICGIIHHQRSRKWCVFEMAAFRAANPTGQIRLVPLFLEVTILALWTSVYFTSWLMYVAAAVQSPLNGAFPFPIAPIALLPMLVAAHILRRFIAEKQTLLEGLANFDVDKSECRLDFDSQFVNTAIEAWYGSKDAFNQYVRGALRRELVAQATHVPVAYFLLFSTIPMLPGVEITVGMWLDGLPYDFILARALQHSLWASAIYCGVMLCLAGFCHRRSLALKLS
ncbi:pucI [Symbiodinium microadriaticum]|nr:pucI [Symbiodinium microadriaticum]